MHNQREFHIFPEKKVSEQEIANIQMFLAGLSQMKDELSKMPMEGEYKGEKIPKNPWDQFLQSAEIDEYFQDDFNWSNEINLNEASTNLKSCVTILLGTSDSPAALNSAISTLRTFFNHPNRRIESINRLQNEEFRVKLQSHVEGQLAKKTSDSNITKVYGLLSNDNNNLHDQEEDNEYSPLLGKTTSNQPKRPLSPILELEDSTYSRFILYLRQNLKTKNGQILKTLLCYLIRDIAYQLNQQPLEQYVLTCPVVMKIRELAIELQLHNSNLDERMRNYQAHKACSEMLPLNDLMGHIISNYTYSHDNATPNSSTHFDETQSSHSSTSSDASYEALLKVKTQSSTQSSQSKTLRKKEEYTSIPQWLYYHFVYNHFFKKLNENFSDSSSIPKRINLIKESVAKNKDQFTSLESLLNFIYLNLDYTNNVPGKESINKLLLESIREFVGISLVHTYFILTELKHTQQLLGRRSENFLLLLEHHRLAAKTEYEYVMGIIASPEQATTIINQYLNVDPNNEIAKILAYIYQHPQAKGPFSPNLQALGSLLNIIACIDFNDKYQTFNDILMTLEISSSSKHVNFLDALILDPSYLTIELTYLNNQNMLSIPANILLRSALVGICSLPFISGITVAYFVLLLNHLKTNMPNEASKRIRDAFEKYQQNVLVKWFSPPTQNHLLRKETDYFDSFLTENEEILFDLQQKKRLTVISTFCHVLLEVLENNRIPEPYNSPTLKHYYQLVRSYAKNNTKFSERINTLIQSDFANLVLFYQAREAGERLNDASIASIERLLSAKGGDRYFITLLFSWLQRRVMLSYSYNLSALNQENSEKLSEDEIQPIYLCLKQNLDHSTIKNNHIFYSKLKEILEKLSLFKECHHLRAMGAILSEQKDSTKYIDNNQKETLPAHFLLMKKENIFKTTEEYIINCLNYLLLCPLENSSDRQLAASILYPPHDRNEFYFTTQDNQRYHRIPAWMMIQHINMIGIQYFITDLILSIWKNIDTASSAEFRFLMRVIIGHEKQEKNLFIQALHNIKDFRGILASFTEKLQAKIDYKKQEIKQYAEYIFYAAVRFANDPPNALDTAKEIAKNCLQHVTTIMQHRDTNDLLLSSSMQYFLKSIEANNKKSFLGESPTLISAIGSLNTKQKEKFDQLVSEIPANQNYPCVLKTRTKVLALVRNSISFLKENSVTQINDPENQLRVQDKVLDSDDQTLLRDTLLSVSIDAINFFTHYLSGNDISEPDPLLDTLAFFTMMQALRTMLGYDYTDLDTPINSSQQPVLDLVSQVNDLPALTTASQTLFAALGIDPSPTQPRIPEYR